MQSVSTLIPRPGVYELYWKFAYERQKILDARLAGKPAPWTDDAILLQYKFCNTFRAADRVSQYMIRDVCYREEQNLPEDRLFQIVTFRIFSNIATWEMVLQYLGHAPVINDLETGTFEAALEHAKRTNGKLYTHAFILASPSVYGRPRKHLNHIELLRDMFVRHSLGATLLAAPSLEAVYNLLHDFPSIGNFMAYQIAIDLNYSAYINFSENDFTKAGPGALRGIQKVFLSTGGMTPEETIMWMVAHQDEEFARFGYDFKGLRGRKLHAIDCQNLFCETDKYCRQAVPGLASSRSKIKTTYAPTGKPVELFLPPKWNVCLGIF